MVGIYRTLFFIARCSTISPVISPSLIPIHRQSIQQSSIHAQVYYTSAPRTIHPPLCQFITHPSRIHPPMPQVSSTSGPRKAHPPLNTHSSKIHPIIIHLCHLYSWWWRIAGPNTNKQINKIRHLITIFINLGLFRHFETVTNIRTWIKSHRYWRML
jgi:hypothetical protein